MQSKGCGKNKKNSIQDKKKDKNKKKDGNSNCFVIFSNKKITGLNGNVIKKNSSENKNKDKDQLRKEKSKN